MRAGPRAGVARREAEPPHRLGFLMPSSLQPQQQRRVPSNRPPLPRSIAMVSSPVSRCDARSVSNRNLKTQASRSSVDLWTARDEDDGDGIASSSSFSSSSTTTTKTKKPRQRQQQRPPPPPPTVVVPPPRSSSPPPPPPTVPLRLRAGKE